MSFPRHSRQSASLLGLSVCLVLPFVPGCGSQEQAQGQTEPAAADSVVQAILGAAAAGPEPSTGPRIPAQEQEARPLNISEMGYNQGSPDAPLKVLELSDFGCGYCGRFHLETYPVLKEIYVDSGLVEWKYIPFVLGMFPNGLEAAVAGECAAEQDQFFPMQTALFQEQGRWRGSDEPEPIFSAMAGELGLDVERFDTCVEAGWRDNYVRANIRLGRQAGVQGTPTFLIDGRPMPGAPPLNGFRDILDLALKQKGVTPPPR